MMKWVSIAIVALASSAGAAVAGDIAAGEKAFRKCIACHTIGENAKPSIGPIQNGLKGRKSGTVPGYNYSDANKNSGTVWNEATFKEYIKDPKAKILGTKMVFAASRTIRRSTTFGPTSNNSMPTAISKSNPNELNVALPPGLRRRTETRTGSASIRCSAP